MIIKNPINIILGSFLSLLACFIFLPGHIFAATYTWDGGGGADIKWSTASNWSLDIVPTAEDTVIFNNTSDNNSTVDAGFQGTVTTININAGYDGTIILQRSLTAISKFTQASGSINLNTQNLIVNSTFTLSGGTFTHGNGTVTFGGSLATLSCNSVSFYLVVFANTGTKIVLSNCVLPLGVNPTLNTAGSIALFGTLSGTGTLTKTAGYFTLNAGAALSGFSGLVTGVFSIAGATFNAGSYAPFTNLTFTLSSGIFTAPSNTMSVISTFTITGGTFNHNNGIVNFGDSTSTLSCNNIAFYRVTFSNTGVKTVGSNCNLPLGDNPVITKSGGIIVNGILYGTGTLTKTAGSLTLNAGAALSGFSGLDVFSIAIAGATLDSTTYSPFTISSNFVLSSGIFTAPSGAMSVSGNFTITGGTFNHNNGIVNFNGLNNAAISCNSAVFYLITFTHTSGVKTVGSDCALPLGDSPHTSIAAITNNGVITASGTWTVNGILTNGSTGVINFSGTTIYLKKDFTQSGIFDLSDKTLVFNGAGTIMSCLGILGGTVQISLTGGSFVNGSGCNISIGASPTTIVGSHLTNNGTITIASGIWTHHVLDNSITGFATISTEGSDLPIVSSRGSVFGSDGKFYGIPYNSAEIAIFDPIANTVVNSNMGADLIGTQKWGHGVLGADNKIYTMPYNASDILIIDPAAGTANRSSMGFNKLGSALWGGGGALAFNGKIYGIPQHAIDILIIDPATGTATTSAMGANLTGANKWLGNAVGGDKKIYGLPFDSMDILIIDPASGMATRSNMGADLSGLSKWYGYNIPASDGKIYATPFNSANILIIDPATGTATTSAMGLDLSGASKWKGGVVAGNGKIYSLPFVATDILVIDPISGTATRSNMGADLSAHGYYDGGKLGPNGKIYALPSQDSGTPGVGILIIDFRYPTLTNNGAIIHNGSGWVTDSSLDNSGTIVFGGTLSLNGSVAQSLTCGTALFNNLTVSNVFGFTFNDNCLISTFILNGTADQNIILSSNNSFFNLIISNASSVTFQGSFAVTGTFTDITPNSKIFFNAGLTYNINSFNIQGTASNNIYLNSTHSGSFWLLNLTTDSIFSNAYVIDSDASLGPQVDLREGGNKDGGNNINWMFASNDVGEGNGSGSGSGSGNSAAVYIPSAAPKLASNANTCVIPVINPAVNFNSPEFRTIIHPISEVLAGSLNENKNETLENEAIQSMATRIPETLNFSKSQQQALSNFIVYGTAETKILGSGERTGSIYSFQAAFGKLPQTEQDWCDVLKIALGQLPNQRSVGKEEQAGFDFNIIYLKDPITNNQQDQTALNIMAYGIRPVDRNLNSEIIAANYFKFIYNELPQTTNEWDLMRAISYGGATR